MNKILNSLMAAMLMTMALTAYSDNVENDLQNNLIRLHIIANSDTFEDQNVKLKVRDEILHKEGERLKADSENKCAKNIKDRLGEIERLANEVLEENGFSYKAYAKYGKFEFPKKEYKNMILPQGEYFGVRIVLGEGNGRNWWCVMYPPLCMMNENEAVLSKKSEEILKKNLAPETYDIITGNDGKIKIKFKIVEAMYKLKKIFAAQNV